MAVANSDIMRTVELLIMGADVCISVPFVSLSVCLSVCRSVFLIE